MVIEILVTTEDGPVVAGKLMNDGNRILTQTTNGYEPLMKTVLNEELQHDDMVITKANPIEWLQALPKHFHGSYLRAQEV